MTTTTDDAIEILVNDDLDYLEIKRPVGITIEEVIECALDRAKSADLDAIAHKYVPMHARQTGPGWASEDDASFRERLKSIIHLFAGIENFISPDALRLKLYSNDRNPYACQHDWKTYVGLTGLNSFDYCSKCDEKRK